MRTTRERTALGASVLVSIALGVGISSYAYGATTYTSEIGGMAGSFRFTDDTIINITPTTEWECGIHSETGSGITIAPGKTVTVNVGGASNDMLCNPGLAAWGAPITLGKVDVTTVDTGVVAYDSPITDIVTLGDNCSIHATGDVGEVVGSSGNGMQSGGGIINVGNNLRVQIDGTSTNDHALAALHAQSGGKIDVGDNATLIVNGNDARGVVNFNATVNIGDNLNLQTYGTDGRGLYAVKYDDTYPARIDVGANALIETRGQTAIGVRANTDSVISFGNNARFKTKGANDGALDALALNAADGGRIDLAAAFEVRTDLVGGAKYSIYATEGGKISNSAPGLVYIEGGLIARGTNSLIDFDLTEGSSIVGAGYRYDAGIINLNMEKGTWKLTDSSTVTAFTSNSDTVNMTYTGAGRYENFIVDALDSVNTNYIFDTDLASQVDGDKIIINNTSTTGTNYISVRDSSLVVGQQVMAPKKLLLVQDASGNSNFQGKSLDTGGLWEITPVVEKLSDNNWYLTMAQATINKSTEDLVGTFESGYGVWRSSLLDDTVRKRLGDLRYRVGEEGIWARIKASKLQGQRFDSSYQMYQVGYDKANEDTTCGIVLDYGKHDNSYGNGRGDGSNIGLSFYVTNYKPSGVYNDLVLRVGKFKTDTDTTGNIKDRLEYDARGYSASYELGKTYVQRQGWFVEPQGQVVYGLLQGGDFTTQRGVEIHAGGINSLIGRLGVVVGRRLQTSDYYLKTNIYREFAGSGDLQMAYGVERMTREDKYKDTWFELGLGGNVRLAKKTYVYGDILKTFGANISKKWQINAGVRWDF